MLSQKMYLCMYYSCTEPHGKYTIQTCTDTYNHIDGVYGALSTGCARILTSEFPRKSSCMGRQIQAEKFAKVPHTTVCFPSFKRV